MGVKVLRSDRHGAITFVTDGKDLRVQTFLKKESIADFSSGGLSGKFALYIFGVEVAWDVSRATPLSSSLFKKWRAES